MIDERLVRISGRRRGWRLAALLAGGRLETGRTGRCVDVVEDPHRTEKGRWEQGERSAEVTGAVCQARDVYVERAVLFQSSDVFNGDVCVCMHVCAPGGLDGGCVSSSVAQQGARHSASASTIPIRLSPRRTALLCPALLTVQTCQSHCML